LLIATAIVRIAVTIIVASSATGRFVAGAISIAEAVLISWTAALLLRLWAPRIALALVPIRALIILAVAQILLTRRRLSCKAAHR